MLLSLVAVAFGQDPPATEDPPPVEAPLPPPDPEALLHLARERLRHGDYEGVRIVCDQALALPGDHQRTAQYLVAMSWELGGDPQQALGLYDALEAAYPTAEIPDDVRFRRAECLGRLQRYDEAEDELGRLPKVDRPPLDQLKIDVLHGLWDLELGKDRRGYKELVRTLDAAAPDLGTYYQADARYALLRRAVQAADELRFEGSDKAKKKALERRAGLITAANDQLAAIITTGETGFALQGFGQMAHAYRSLGHDMLAESPLTGLTADQLALNRSMLKEKVDGLWTKASRYYDRGLQLAAEAQWTAEPVPSLHAEYDALVVEVNGLATAP